MAAATVTVNSPGSGYHRITVTGPTNGDVTSLPQVYNAIQGLSNTDLRNSMQKIGGNTYSVNHFTGVNVMGSYTQLVINANVRFQIPEDTKLAFSQSSTTTTVTSLYCYPGSYCTFYPGSQIDYQYNTSAGNRYGYFYGSLLSSGSTSKPVIFRNGNLNLFYCYTPSQIINTHFVDNRGSSIYLSYVSIDSLPVIQFRDIKIYNVTQAMSVGIGFNVTAGGMFPNMIIDGFEIYNKAYPILNGGSTIKFKNGYIYDCFYSAIIMNAGGNVVSPAYETSKDDTRYPTGRFQSFCHLQNITIKNFGKITSGTYYGILANYNTYVYCKNCLIIKDDGNLNTGARIPTIAARGSIVLQHGTGSQAIGHTAYVRSWSADGTFLKGCQVDITVLDPLGYPITNSTITTIQGSTPYKQRWFGMTNAQGKLVNVYGDPMVLVNRQQISSNSFQPWSDGSTQQLKHIFTITAPGYEMFQTKTAITQDTSMTVVLYPKSNQISDAPGIQIGQGISI